MAFCVLALINTLGLVPGPIAGALNELSSWMLVAAIVAIGIKTSLQSILRVGPVPRRDHDRGDGVPSGLGFDWSVRGLLRRRTRAFSILNESE